MLENAWDNEEIVDLELAERPQTVAPFKPIIGPNIRAKVLVVENGHKGRLAVHENRIVKENTRLKQVVFCLVDFSDFRKIEHLSEHMARHGNLQSSLKSIQDEFPDAVEVKIVRPPRISLRAGEEWEVILTEDSEQTRNHKSHSGLITRKNGKEFAADEADNLLAGLNQFFAFASCAYRHPTAIIGENSHGNAVWGQIGKFDLMPRSTNWFKNDSSAPAAAYLESLFPKFWSKWQEHPEELSAIIESHINSIAMQQAGLPKEAVAASYTGLDLLANLILEDPNPCDSVANVCKALECYDIPHRRLKQSKLPITTQLANKLGAGKSGPHVIYSVRNYVVRPLARNTDTIKQEHLEHLDSNYSPYIYLHDLCQFYLEYLLLIGLVGYRPQHFRILIEARRRTPNQH